MTAKKKKNHKKAEHSDAALDHWLQSIANRPRCHTCRDTTAAATIRRLLQAMIRNRVKVSLRGLYRKTKEIHSGYGIGFWGFRVHLYNCERDLYEKVTGQE